MSAARLFPLDGAQRSCEAVARWFARVEPPDLRDLAVLWFRAWRACGDDVFELLHDGHPTVCVEGVALGYVNAFSAHVNVGFFLGATLADPDRLLLGRGRFMRHVRVRPDDLADADAEALRSLMREAYADLKRRLASP